MPIQDSSPERRNLTVTSLSIIIFFLAGGEITNSDLRLQIVNIHFTKTYILEYFLWMMLVWFLFRYWQTFKGKISEVFGYEIGSSHRLSAYKWYLTKIKKVDGHLKSNCHLNNYLYNNPYKGWIIRYKYETKKIRQTDGSLQEFPSPDGDEEKYYYVDMGVIFKLTIMLYISIKAFINNAEFASLVSPYAFALAAIGLGITSLESGIGL